MKVKTSVYVQTTMNYIRFLVRYLLLNVKEMEKTTNIKNENWKVKGEK